VDKLKKKLLEWGLRMEVDEYHELIYGLYENAIHLIYGYRNSGKSYWAYETCLEYLEKGGDRSVYYYDGDGTGRTNKIFADRIKKQSNFFYWNSSGRNDLPKLLINEVELKDCILIFDSIKDFFMGLNIDNNADVIEFYSYIKGLARNNTIVLIGHATAVRNKHGAISGYKVQGNENGLTATPHFVYQAGINKEIRVEKSRNIDLLAGAKIREKVMDYLSYDGQTLNSVKQSLGYHNKKEVQEEFDRNEGKTWKYIMGGQRGTAKIFKVI